MRLRELPRTVRGAARAVHGYHESRRCRWGRSKAEKEDRWGRGNEHVDESESRGGVRRPRCSGPSCFPRPCSRMDPPRRRRNGPDWRRPAGSSRSWPTTRSARGGTGYPSETERLAAMESLIRANFDLGFIVRGGAGGPPRRPEARPGGAGGVRCAVLRVLPGGVSPESLALPPGRSAGHRRPPRAASADVAVRSEVRGFSGEWVEVDWRVRVTGEGLRVIDIVVRRGQPASRAAAGDRGGDWQERLRGSDARPSHADHRSDGHPPGLSARARSLRPAPATRSTWWRRLRRAGRTSLRRGAGGAGGVGGSARGSRPASSPRRTALVTSGWIAHCGARTPRWCGAFAAATGVSGCCRGPPAGPLRTGPKLLVGFSDVTALHVFINQHWGWPTPARRDLGRSREREIVAELAGGAAQGGGRRGGLAPCRLSYSLQPLNPAARRRRAVAAPLIGGNLKTLQSLVGTPWAMRAAGRILIVEDTGERGYAHRPDAGSAPAGRGAARRAGAGVRPVHGGAASATGDLPATRSWPASRRAYGIRCSRGRRWGTAIRLGQCCSDYGRSLISNRRAPDSTSPGPPDG